MTAGIALVACITALCALTLFLLVKAMDGHQ